MNKKVEKIMLLIIVVWCIFITTDFTLSLFNHAPIFAWPVFIYRDGGTTEYYGLGYKVKKYKQAPALYDPARKDAIFKLWGFSFDS